MNATASEPTATATVTAAITRLLSPSQVNTSTRPTCGPSSAASSSSAGCIDSSSEAFMPISIAQGLDRCGPESELVEDLCPVLQVAHQRAAPGFIVELVR